MKLKPLGSNQTELTKPDGTTVFFSYQTPVSCFIPGEGYFKTDAYYSRTTSKHISRWLDGSSATVKPQEFFDKLI